MSNMTASEFREEFNELFSQDTRRASKYLKKMWAVVFPKYAGAPPESVALAKHAVYWRLKHREGVQMNEAGKRSIRACIASCHGKPYKHYLSTDEVSRIELADRNYGSMR